MYSHPFTIYMNRNISQTNQLFMLVTKESCGEDISMELYLAREQGINLWISIRFLLLKTITTFPQNFSTKYLPLFLLNSSHSVTQKVAQNCDY